jgi:hypothetical protein
MLDPNIFAISIWLTKLIKLESKDSKEIMADESNMNI